MFAGAGDPLAPVQTPEGRFHHSGQSTLYASFTVEGALVAALTYLSADDPLRVIYPLTVEARGIADLTRPGAAARFGIDLSAATQRWQDARAAGRAPASWALADTLRARGADGMVYASRKRPELTHLVLFRWNAPGAPVLARAGAPLPFARP